MVITEGLESGEPFDMKDGAYSYAEAVNTAEIGDERVRDLIEQEKRFR